MPRKRKLSPNQEKEEKDETVVEEAICPSEVTKLRDFQKIANRHTEKAYQNFFAMKLQKVQWKSPKSDETYDLCITDERRTDEVEKKEWDWPHAWVGKECQRVLAAVWHDGKLMALHTYSPNGDETNLYYISQMNQEDLWALVEDKQYSELLSVSSGDDKVKSLNCPALETLEESS